MRITGIVIISIFVTRAAMPECVEVEGSHESPRTVRIDVTLWGKPLKGAKVDFYRQGTPQPAFEANTDASGAVITPKLAPADYRVVASLDEEIQAFESLHVVDKEGTKSFPIEISGPWSSVRLQDPKADGAPVLNRVATFQGTVSDASGAAIGVARIRVMKVDAPPADFMVATKADQIGHFEVSLPEGRYVAYVFANGFRTERLRFEVIKNGTRDLHIELTPGSC